MKILFSPEVYLQLQTIAEIVKGREFSGYGFVNTINKDNDVDFEVYDIVLLDVGTGGFTEFDSDKILQVLKRKDADKMKLWFHRHPLGNGVPGPNNWSQTDKDTCTLEPLGCPDPRQVGWALAAVLTPNGWVGRLDCFSKDEIKTKHIPVDVRINRSILDTAAKLLREQEDNEVLRDVSELFQTTYTETEYSDEDAEAYVDMALELIQGMWETYIQGSDPLYWEDYEYCENIADAFVGIPHLSGKVRKLKRKLKRLFNHIKQINGSNYG